MAVGIEQRDRAAQDRGDIVGRERGDAAGESVELSLRDAAPFIDPRHVERVERGGFQQRRSLAARAQHDGVVRIVQREFDRDGQQRMVQPTRRARPARDADADDQLDRLRGGAVERLAQREQRIVERDRLAAEVFVQRPRRPHRAAVHRERGVDRVARRQIGEAQRRAGAGQGAFDMERRRRRGIIAQVDPVAERGVDGDRRGTAREPLDTQPHRLPGIGHVDEHGGQAQQLVAGTAETAIIRHVDDARQAIALARLHVIDQRLQPFALRHRPLMPPAAVVIRRRPS